MFFLEVTKDRYPFLRQHIKVSEAFEILADRVGTLWKFLPEEGIVKILSSRGHIMVIFDYCMLNTMRLTLQS